MKLVVIYGIGFVASLVIDAALDLVFPAHRVRWEYELGRSRWDGALFVLYAIGLAFWKRFSKRSQA